MLIKGIVNEDFVNYKKSCMIVEFPFCSMKCGPTICQNNPLLDFPNIEITYKRIVDLYVNNPLTEAIVMQGLEPFDSPKDLFNLIDELRKNTFDDIVIYTGYEENEIISSVEKLKMYENIIIKFGRFIPDDESIYDEVLGVTLASKNQYGKRIS